MESMKGKSATLSTLATGLALTLALVTASVSAQEVYENALKEVFDKHQVDIKKLFSAKCSWCHQGMGMKQADGPKLAGTLKTKEQVMEQIRRGKSPMPGFRSQLSEKEIEALADYIKALPK